MRILLVGPGRAGMSLAVSFIAAGHEIAGVVGRTAESASVGAEIVGAEPLTLDEPLPAGDLLVIATRDSAIAPVARALADKDPEVASAVHVSGLTSVQALDPLQGQGMQTGSFHPLQTLPTPEAGAARLLESRLPTVARN